MADVDAEAEAVEEEEETLVAVVEVIPPVVEAEVTLEVAEEVMAAASEAAVGEVDSMADLVAAEVGSEEGVVVELMQQEYLGEL
jgi:hypothetical protein